jgi:hypothetical protein
MDMASFVWEHRENVLLMMQILKCSIEIAMILKSVRSPKGKEAGENPGA